MKLPGKKNYTYNYNLMKLVSTAITHKADFEQARNKKEINYLINWSKFSYT